jgi:RimJ/RimL family protein N-acetyltransferase
VVSVSEFRTQIERGLGHHPPRIGNRDAGRGLGPAVVREFGTNYIFANDGLGAIVADPSVSNLYSVSAFKKAGFNSVKTVQLEDEAFERHVVRLDRIEK